MLINGTKIKLTRSFGVIDLIHFNIVVYTTKIINSFKKRLLNTFFNTADISNSINAHYRPLIFHKVNTKVIETRIMKRTLISRPYSFTFCVRD